MNFSYWSWNSKAIPRLESLVDFWPAINGRHNMKGSRGWEGKHCLESVSSRNCWIVSCLENDCSTENNLVSLLPAIKHFQIFLITITYFKNTWLDIAYLWYSEGFILHTFFMQYGMIKCRVYVCICMICNSVNIYIRTWMYCLTEILNVWDFNWWAENL